MSAQSALKLDTPRLNTSIIEEAREEAAYTTLGVQACLWARPFWNMIGPASAD